ncbi:MAG: diguanylate cyclase, partial [Vallitaleaceae bacterium]|nr:diguanylate cyclase [Vallitaleaceae bacterium]
MKIKYKLLISYGVLVVLAFTIVGVNLLTFQAMLNDSNFVNYSGKLRATSYKMAQVSNVIVNRNDESSKFELEKRIDLFDDLLVTLSYGNAALGMTKLTHVPTMVKMELIKGEWITKYRPAFVSILNSSDEASLTYVNSSIDAYVDIINEMVTSYSEYARHKAINAKLINGILTFVVIVISIFSFTYINQSIRKPISALIEELKELSLIDSEISKKIESSKKDEIAEMIGYFNELIYDGLTRVYSRRAGLSKLTRLLQHDERRSQTMSLCFIDINGLKQVNDVLGHKYGDELIISAIEAIKSTIREEDFIVRMGGDEFIIVFNEIGIEIAEAIWLRVVDVYEKINEMEKRPYLISVSHGIVYYNSKQQSEVDLLIK